MEGTAHKIADLLRAIAGKPNPKNFTSAVIAAAGDSLRMGGDTPKLFLDLNGLPVGLYSLLTYQQCDCIHEIIVVTKKEFIPVFTKWKEQYALDKLAQITEGSETRADSVRKGLDIISPQAKYVAIADGARALTTPQEIAKVCHAAWQHGCATAARHATDTVKIGDKNAFIDQTPDRKQVWHAQTPQVFRVAVYRAAAYVAVDEGIKSTDDNQLVEHIGNPVKLVECSDENLKITTPFDMICARALLTARTDPDSPSYMEDVAAYIAVARQKNRTDSVQPVQAETDSSSAASAAGTEESGT